MFCIGSLYVVTKASLQYTRKVNKNDKWPNAPRTVLFAPTPPKHNKPFPKVNHIGKHFVFARLYNQYQLSLVLTLWEVTCHLWTAVSSRTSLQPMRSFIKKIKAYWLRKIITVTFFFSQGLPGNGGKSGPLSSPRIIACSMTIEMERGENLRLYWSHIGLYFIKHPLALLLTSPNWHPLFELLCTSVLVCENVWVCVWVCLILDQYLSPCETLSSQFPPALWESNEWPCRGRTESLANGQAVAPPKRGGETFDLRPFTKDKTKM